MAKFLTTHQTAAQIENIIIEAEQKLVLVTPYLQLSSTFFTRIKDADERGIKIVLVYGKDQLKPNEKAQIETIKNFGLFFCENLHAKCYFNEKNMVITSMNMYEFSEKNNREMGVLITQQNDSDVFKAAVREVQSIVQSSIKKKGEDNKVLTQATSSKEKTIDKPEVKNEKIGLKELLKDALSTILSGEELDAYCIRCGDKIPFDPDHPLCDECYWEWALYKNPNYTEHYCHSCGGKFRTTYGKPLCYSCFTGG